jgi:hypothetical protein
MGVGGENAAARWSKESAKRHAAERGRLGAIIKPTRRGMTIALGDDSLGGAAPARKKEIDRILLQKFKRGGGERI